MKIYCIGCDAEVDAYLTNGMTIYPHRPDLADLPFWQCPRCKGYVGCHHQTKDRTKPLGVIPTAEVREVRKAVHAELDPIWKNGLMPRGKLYKKLTKRLGYQYHTASIVSVEQGARVLAEVREIKDGLGTE